MAQRHPTSEAGGYTGAMQSSAAFSRLPHGVLRQDRGMEKVRCFRYTSSWELNDLTLSWCRCGAVCSTSDGGILQEMRYQQPFHGSRSARSRHRAALLGPSRCIHDMLVVYINAAAAVILLTLRWLLLGVNEPCVYGWFSPCGLWGLQGRRMYGTKPSDGLCTRAAIRRSTARIKMDERDCAHLPMYTNYDLRGKSLAML